MSSMCLIEGCDREARVKGKCQRCYQLEYSRRKRLQNPASKEKLLAMMDPAWYIPAWHTQGNVPWGAEQIAAKQRLQALYRTGMLTKGQLSVLIGVGFGSVSDYLRNEAY